MGIIRQGVLGGFRNKTGSVIGAYWRKHDVIRGLPRISNKPPTQAQLEQRIKFGLVTNFLSYMSDLIDQGYSKGNSTSPMNEAVSYHLREAVTGVSPNFTLDYTKLRFSNGKVRTPGINTVEAATGAKAEYTWSEDGDDRPFKDATDMVNLVVYNASVDRFVVFMAAAPRSALAFSMQLPPDFVGHEVYCFLSITSLKIKDVHSVTEFVGTITVE